MVITPTTDLTPFKGARVVISGFRYARIADINHGADAQHTGDALAGGVWGLMFEEARGLPGRQHGLPLRLRHHHRPHQPHRSSPRRHPHAIRRRVHPRHHLPAADLRW